jgi:hypothetical protein
MPRHKSPSQIRRDQRKSERRREQARRDVAALRLKRFSTFELLQELDKRKLALETIFEHK